MWTRIREYHCLNMFLVVAVTAIVGAVIADPTQPGCCVPSQWEGLQGGISGRVQGGSPSVVDTNSFISYDETNQIMATTTYIHTEGYNTEIKTILDYNKKMQYVINEKSQSCSPSPVTTPFQKICLPADAMPQGKFYFGLGANVLDAVSFKVTVNGTDVTVVATPEGCIPVLEILTSGNIAGAATMEAIGFVNLTTGIKDRSVFNIPSFCTQKKPTGFGKIVKKRGVLVF